ncbi:MAG: hypothetical protein U1F44_03895 [Coriobacteriia bacterium]|nr:hypothetical protein [Coriobacteriia bacterium]
MSTSDPSATLEQALASIPAPLRRRLIKSYGDLKKDALEGEHDAAGFRAGKLAEVLLRATQHLLTGAYTPLSTNIKNFKQQCEQIEGLPATAGPDGLRILMPRALSFLYTLRNKRDFGHAGGEVDANEIDAATAVRLSDWCICELIRASQGIPLEDAQLLCDAIAGRQIPLVWKVLGRRRVLDASLNYREQTLLLLYSELETGVATEDLVDWTEHPNRANFRRDVLSRLHKARLIEWDRETDMAVLSPLGIEEVEGLLLTKIGQGKT